MTAASSAGRLRPVAARRLRPVPALDGVRGVAVAAVVLFHFPTTTVVKGGLFGVDVFFVLSGFLVTAGLLDDADGHAGAPRVRAFLARRVWRLVPALVAFLIVVTAMAVFFRTDPWFTSNPFGGRGVSVPMTRIWKGDAYAIAYVYNFAVIKGWLNAMPFAHLWTLAIEGQFYVGWALVLRLVARRHRSLVLPFTLVVIVVSAISPWLIWHRYGDSFLSQAIIYFGTVPRLQQLFAGALVAQIWREGWLDRVPRLVLGALAALCGTGVLCMFFTVGNVTFKYLGAETVVAAATGLVVAYLFDSPAANPVGRILSSPPLRWLGTRSYAIYLWHWPLAVWTQDFDHAWGVPVGMAAALVAAELSWRVVEQPTQRFVRRRRAASAQRLANASSPAGLAST